MSCIVRWEELRKTRVLIAPENGTCYLFNNGMLQELQSYGSWFLGVYISQDGSLYMATPVDPVFILLSIFDKARMKKGEDLGKFRHLDEILYVQGYQHLLSLAEKCMEIVCQTQGKLTLMVSENMFEHTL